MNKRQFLTSAAAIGVSITPALGATNAKTAACAAAPAILTLSGAIKRTKRGAL
jgi:hypothetical protein